MMLRRIPMRSTAGKAPGMGGTQRLFNELKNRNGSSRRDKIAERELRRRLAIETAHCFEQTKKTELALSFVT